MANLLLSNVLDQVGRYCLANTLVQTNATDIVINVPCASQTMLNNGLVHHLFFRSLTEEEVVLASRTGGAIHVSLRPLLDGGLAGLIARLLQEGDQGRASGSLHLFVGGILGSSREVLTASNHLGAATATAGSVLPGWEDDVASDNGNVNIAERAKHG
jgi:hypothetical protein